MIRIDVWPDDGDSFQYTADHTPKRKDVIVVPCEACKGEGIVDAGTAGKVINCSACNGDKRKRWSVDRVLYHLDNNEGPRILDFVEIWVVPFKE